jgi:cytoplasmic iron level regulating protein YaaA (DUF328/UPF0246 family)
MIILLHSSKTMKTPHNLGGHVQQPELLNRAKELATYLKTISPSQLAKAMQISPQLAEKTGETIASWDTAPEHQSLAIDSFVGDIYSGLQASQLDTADRVYANQNLRILSGLYGTLKPLDAICPYRLEMGYRLPDVPYQNLYGFWGDSIAKTLPEKGWIINLTAVEYAKTVTPFVDNHRIITPRFLTFNPQTKQATFVVVHAKVARGAFAHWMIKHRITNINDLHAFNDLGYSYDPTLSTASEPAFVCHEFGGLGLSVRLK